MKKFKLNFFSRLIKGIKKGYLTPTLPQHIINLQKNPLIRILRVLGGISILLILTKKLTIFGEGLSYTFALWVCLFLTLIFSIYLIFITYHRIKHMIKVFNSEDLDVKNSPLDKFASIAARIIWCSKGFCETAAPVGVIFGGMVGINELRRAKGLEPIFLPKLADLIFPDNDNQREFKQMKYKEAALERNFKEANLYKEEHNIVDVFEAKGIISKADAEDWRAKLMRNEAMCTLENKRIKSKILDSLEN